MKNILIALTITVLMFTTLLLGWDKYQEKLHRSSQQASEDDGAPKYSVPVVKQWRGDFKFENGVMLSNNFDGARLNGAISSDDSLITVLITPENTPIKSNPWYAFKVWSEEQKEVYIRFSYPKGISHRYYPKISTDGKMWEKIENNHFINYSKAAGSLETGDMPEEALIRLNTGPDTLWVAANKVVTTNVVETWLETISSKPFIDVAVIGESHQKKPIYTVGIENEQADKNIVILTRQYPSMSVGYLAMQSFINQLTADTEAAEDFRSKYNVYLFPHINPDGVDHGHWSHNMGGINLAEDWGNSMQPEVKFIKTYIDSLTKTSGNDFYLNIDFRSNRESILYVFNTDKNNKMEGLTKKIADSVGNYLSEYTTTVKPRRTGKHIYRAEDYFYNEYAMESLIVIIDEDSTHDLIDKKGRALAESVMEHLIGL